MADRKPLSKKTRFEVFKRDKFTCQYCGKSAPDVVLEVDHIKPVAEGGTNDMVNLVTSCFDCNRGKGKTLLADDTQTKLELEEIRKLAERREQIEMMLKWKEQELASEDKLIDTIDDLCNDLTGYELSDKGRIRVKDLIDRFGYDLVYDSTRIAFTNYPTNTDWQWERAFSKIGGICYNKSHKLCRQCAHSKKISEYVECPGVECPDELVDDDYTVHCGECPHYKEKIRVTIVAECDIDGSEIRKGQLACGKYVNRYGGDSNA